MLHHGLLDKLGLMSNTQKATENPASNGISTRRCALGGFVASGSFGQGTRPCLGHAQQRHGGELSPSPAGNQRVTAGGKTSGVGQHG